LTSVSFCGGAWGILEDELSIKNPMLLVGIGGVGSRIAAAASAALECKCLLISNDKRDLVNNDRCAAIFIHSGEWINPSSYKLRSFVEGHRNEIATAMQDYSTVIVVSNLAGRAGTAIAPLVCKMAKDSRIAVVSVAIMPFKYETDRIFSAGTALRRVREVSDSTIVMDNDAFLDNNPELSEQDCFDITNNAIVEVIASISSSMIKPALNVLCTSRANPSSESSLRDSLAMLYDTISDASSVKRAMLYVMGGKRVPIGELNKLVGCVRQIFKEDGSIEVGMSSSMSTSNSIRVHLVASAPQKTRFDSYDPLGEIIPDALDWEEPDSAPDIKLTIPAID
jgi:cell division protein FtsZ